MNIYVSRKSPLAFNHKLTPDQVLQYPLVIYNGTNMRFFINHIFKHHGPINIFFESSNTEVIKDTIAEGLAIGMFSNLAFKNDSRVKSGAIVPIPLDVEASDSFYGLLRSKEAHSSPVIKCLEEIIHKVISASDV